MNDMETDTGNLQLVAGSVFYSSDLFSSAHTSSFKVLRLGFGV